MLGNLLENIVNTQETVITHYPGKRLETAWRGANDSSLIGARRRAHTLRAQRSKHMREEMCVGEQQMGRVPPFDW